MAIIVQPCKGCNAISRHRSRRRCLVFAKAEVERHQQHEGYARTKQHPCIFPPPLFNPVRVVMQLHIKPILNMVSLLFRSIGATGR